MTTPSNINSSEKKAGYDIYPFDLELLYGFFNVINRDWCELSRTENTMRGAGIFIGIGMLIAATILGFVAVVMFSKIILGVMLFFCTMYLLLCSIIFLSFKIDFCTPADEPIRLNRITQKIYVYSYHRSWNPFKKWYREVKVYHWADIRAELGSQGGPVGYGYVSRVNLTCIVCKPGTEEELERFVLIGNLPHGMAAGLPELWRYCQTYMQPQWAMRLPVPELRDGRPTLNNSFKQYLPLLVYGEEGRKVREEMSSGQWLVSCLALLALPLSLPMALCHYGVMRYAAKVDWPVEIKAESETREEDVVRSLPDSVGEVPL